MSSDRYSVAQASQASGLTRSQVRRFASTGAVPSKRERSGRYTFGFDDVALLRTAGQLLIDGIPQARVRSAFRSAREQLPEGVDVTQVVLKAESDRVVVSFDGDKWDPDSGQAVLNLDETDVVATVASLDAARPERRVPDRADAEQWFLTGDAAERDDLHAAEAAYRSAIEIDPSHVDSHLNLGRLLHSLGRTEEALVHYRTAVHLDPGDATAWFNLGVALEDTGDVPAAIDGYERAIRVEPAFADAHFNLASLYERDGSELAALRHRREYKRLRS